MVSTAASRDVYDGSHRLELAVGGMTCASCANRVEKKLNKLDGVTATVNYATEKAAVTFPEDLDPHLLVEQVEAAGYTAQLPAEDGSGNGGGDEGDAETEALRNRLVISAALAIPVVLMSMVPALQFDNWQWLALTLALSLIHI